MLKVNEKNGTYVVSFFYMVFLFAKIQTRLEVPLFNDNYFILGYCAIITIALLFTIKNNKNLINTRFLFLIIILLLYTIIFTTVFYEETLAQYINSYFLAFTSFLVFVFFTAYYFCIKNNVLLLIKSTYILISSFLLGCYVIYFDNFNTILHLNEYFSLNRTRSAFGFVHENTVAEVALAALVCAFILYIAYKDNKLHITRKFYNYLKVSSLILIVMIISSSSRGALLAIFTMGIVYYYLYLRANKKQAVNRILFKYTIFIISFIGVIIIYNEFIRSGKFDIEYRLMNFTSNIPLLIEKGKLFTGLGFVERSIFSRGLIIEGTGYTDNYYLYVLVSTGIIGCMFIGTFFVILWKYIFINGKLFYNSKISRVIKSIFAMVLVFAMTQATLLSPVSILSIVSMIIFIAYVVKGDTILNETRRRKC